MKTILDDLINDQTKLKLATEKIEVLRTSLFGVSHWRLNGYDFEQRVLGSGFRAIKYWVIIFPNGKELVGIKYKYLLGLTFKLLKLI